MKKVERRRDNKVRESKISWKKYVEYLLKKKWLTIMESIYTYIKCEFWLYFDIFKVMGWIWIFIKYVILIIAWNLYWCGRYNFIPLL